MNQDEEMKYKKKKESDISKSSRKAKHKHNYAPCIVELMNPMIIGKRRHDAIYCTECGKLNNIFLKYTEREDVPLFTMNKAELTYVDLDQLQKEEIIQDRV